MTLLCDDIDLLCQRPTLVEDAPAIAQALWTGTGDVSGTVLTLPAGALSGLALPIRSLVRLEGSVQGIGAVIHQAGEALTISRIHAALLVDPDAPAIGMGTAAGVTVTLLSYAAQIELAGRRLMEKVAAGRENAVLTNPHNFRRAIALGTLETIYAAASTAPGAPDELAAAAAYFRWEYPRALWCLVAHIDLDGDGYPDFAATMDHLRLDRF